jgi:hypothetical protein
LHDVVQELEKSVLELKASEDRLLQTVEEYEKDLEHLRASRGHLQVLKSQSCPSFLQL